MRPSTISVSSVRLAGRRDGTWARLAAGWLGRMCAGGVGPRPSNPRRRWPPEPTVGPFLVPDLRIAPRRRELPAIYLPSPPHVHCGPSAVLVDLTPAFLRR